jgi:hypothetical protein
MDVADHQEYQDDQKDDVPKHESQMVASIFAFLL